jgi:dTDP-4-dehydrorhamnose reductase
MRKILIIGSKGMLGQELVRVFKKDSDYKVIGWDKEDIDITREKEIDKKTSIIKPEIIINAAAYNAVDKCEEDKKEYELAKKVNGIAPGYLARASKKNKAIFVHYSSDYVFDGDLEKLLFSEPSGCTHVCSACLLHEGRSSIPGFNEESKPNPISKYGESKLLGEKEVSKNAKNYYIIRPSWIFGKPAISENAKRSFFDVMLELGKKNKEVKVVENETGRFTYAPDLAKKTKEIIDSKKPFGVYHVTNNDSCTRYEACQELYRLAKIKIKVIPVPASEFPRPAKRPQYSVLLNTKLNPMRNWKEALREYLKD